MAERMSVGPPDSYADLKYTPERTNRLEGEYLNGFGETSPNGTYTVCCIDDCDTVTLFAEGNLVYEKPLTGSYDMAVANNGTAVVSGFTEGGYQDGDHLLYVWDDQGTELFSEELRATTSRIEINDSGAYAVIHTEQVLEQFDDATPWDSSIYVLDIGAGEMRARYTEQIPGIEPPGPRREQIERIGFVETADKTVVALYGRGTGEVPPDVLDLQDVPDDITVIDLDGNLIQRGEPHIDRYPDHYELTDEAKDRLGITDSESESATTTQDSKVQSQEQNRGQTGGQSDSQSELENHVNQIQSWTPSEQEDIDPQIESSIDAIGDILDKESPPLGRYPDLSATLFEITVTTAGLDPRQNADPSRLFEEWYAQHPEASIEATAVETALDRLESMGTEVTTLSEEYYDLPDYQDPDVNTVEVLEKTEDLQEALDSLYYGAQALGRIISACIPAHGTVIVPFTGTGLTYLGAWTEEENPDSYDDPPGYAGLRKASADILQSLAEHDPAGLADELYEHRQQLYELCPAPSDADQTTPGNESKTIAGTVLRLVVPLLTKYPEALEPILPSLINNVGRDYVFQALENAAQNQPAQLLLAFDSLTTATERGRDFEPATGQVDYPDMIAKLLQSAASEAPEVFWTAVAEWLTAEQEPEPRVVRALLDSVADHITDDSTLRSGKQALQTVVKHPDWQLRRIAVDLLKNTTDPELERLLEELASDPIPEVSDPAQDALADNR